MPTIQNKEGSYVWFSYISPWCSFSFFYNYLNCLIKASLPEKKRRWYVKRVEEFIKAQKGQKIKGLSGTDIAQYFEMIGRQNRLAGWQFSQCIDAIRILYCDLLKTHVCQQLNWHYWFDFANQLEFDHPTTARQLTPDELSYIKERKGDGPLSKVQASHHDLLVRFTTEMRRRGYVCRTEQSYEQYVPLPNTLVEGLHDQIREIVGICLYQSSGV